MSLYQYITREVFSHLPLATSQRPLVLTGSLVTGAVIGGLWLLWSRVANHSALDKLPSRPRGSFLYGNMKDYFNGRDMNIFTRWMREMGTGIIRYYHCMGAPRVMVADADALKHIMVTNADNYVRPNYVREIFEQGIGMNLLFMNGDEHQVHRRLCSQAFLFPVLQRMIPDMQSQSEGLVDLWTGQVTGDPQYELDIGEDLSRLASDTIAKCGFGLDMDSLFNPKTAVTNAFNNVSKYKPGVLRFILPTLSMTIPTGANRRFQKNLKLCDDIIAQAMDTKRSLINDDRGEASFSDILSVLLLARDDESGQTLSQKQLRDHAMFFFAAGIQNTATCMSWVLLTLAQKPEIQVKVREEVRQHMPEKGDEITYDHLQKLKYLNSVIKETLRFHPVISNFNKQAVEDDVVNGYVIPAGTIVTLCVDALHRNEKYWENPDEFIPDRFLDERATNHAWLPFGAGPKMCLGYKFSLIEMRITLALLLRDLHFELGSTGEYRPKKCITMFPDPPLKLRARIV